MMQTHTERADAPALVETTAPEVNEPKPEFEINSEDAANWYLKKLAGIEAEKQRVSQQFALITAQLNADADSLRYLYEGQLQNFVRQELARRGNRRKSLVFLQGTACFRTVPGGLKISDPMTALAYCREWNRAAVKTVETLDTAAYRKQAEALLEKSGEVLPGVETVPEKESFTVKFGGKD